MTSSIYIYYVEFHVQDFVFNLQQMHTNVVQTSWKKYASSNFH